MSEKSSEYQEIMIAAGSVIAVSATLGAEIDNDPRYEPIREAWLEHLEGVTEKLNKLCNDMVSFGEAFDGEEE